MTDEPQLHDLTKFLLARLESYPEEFVAGRWDYEIGLINEVKVGNNQKVLNDAIGNHRMDLALQHTLKKLLVLDGSFTSACYDSAAQAYALMRENGTSFRIPQHLVEDDPHLLTAIKKLVLR